jgi:hypothetical protein
MINAVKISPLKLFILNNLDSVCLQDGKSLYIYVVLFEKLSLSVRRAEREHD